jgi:hypothetical protein
MLRKLLLPVFAIVLLGGCMTGGYSYRHDRGDYYYGQPGVDYRYYDQYGGGYYDPRYRYPGYYPGYYGSRYGGYGYGGFPYGYYRPPVIVVRPGHGHGDNHNHRPPRPDGDRSNDRAPWRDYERLQRERIQRSTPPPAGNSTLRAPVPAQVRPAAPTSRPSAPSAPRGNDRGSRMEKAMQRAQSSREKE